MTRLEQAMRCDHIETKNEIIILNKIVRAFKVGKKELKENGFIEAEISKLDVMTGKTTYEKAWKKVKG